ncbi:MAG: DNA photolyase family protein [Alphaproteobacteria bacterium]|nr:DNA photolyase family protein [Alphaproteobacteria bacterium]
MNGRIEEKKLLKLPMNIIWFKRDLRIEDHEPLFAACAAGKILPLYIIEPELWQQPDSSRRHWHFIHDSLQDLDQSLRHCGAKLIIRTGSVLAVLQDFYEKLGLFILWSHEETGNLWTFRRDISVRKWCRDKGISWHEFSSNGVVRCLKNRDEWAKLRNERMKKGMIPLPSLIHCVNHITSEPIPPKDDHLFGKSIEGLTQRGGRSEGIKTLHSFLEERSKKYILTLSKPGVSARHCSRLSAHIAYGALSVREIEKATKEKFKSYDGIEDQEAKYFRSNLSAFLSRLAWRCHFVQKLEQQPEIEINCMHSAFEGMREPYFREDYFEAWKNGRTGYPLVDACMRSLIQNGWINFRMRAMLVSFASYHLWLDWRQTAPYMAGLFTDYEPGIHYSQFQMQSGVTGINALRIYNPIKQSLEQDPEGKFILRYVPELKNVPLSFIHEPWKLHSSSSDYSLPIVDHKLALQKVREHIAQRHQTDGFREKAHAVYKKLSSRQTSRHSSSKILKALTTDKRQLTLSF